MGAVGVRIGVHEVGEEAAQDGCQMLLQKRSLESWLYIKRDRVQTFAKAFKKVSLNTQKKEKTRWGEETWTRWGTMNQKRYFQLSSCFVFSVSSLLSLWTDFCIDPIFKEYSASLPSYVFNCNSENIKKVVLGYCNRSISIYFSPMNGSSVPLLLCWYGVLPPEPFQRPVKSFIPCLSADSQDSGQICPLYTVLCICITYKQIYIYEIVYLERDIRDSLNTLYRNLAIWPCFKQGGVCWDDLQW